MIDITTRLTVSTNASSCSYQSALLLLDFLRILRHCEYFASARIIRELLQILFPLKHEGKMRQRFHVETFRSDLLRVRVKVAKAQKKTQVRCTFAAAMWKHRWVVSVLRPRYAASDLGPDVCLCRSKCLMKSYNTFWHHMIAYDTI